VSDPSPDNNSVYRESRLRQELIYSIVLHKGEVRSPEIAEAARSSLATVRRDLAALERRGLIERTWGGAKVRSPINYLSNFDSEASHRADEKRAVSSAASGLVEPGMVVGVSGGTTCTELGRWLRGKPVTVVTNAINVATELYNHARTRVVVTGGALNSYSYELVGEAVTRSLEEYRLDICFLGCSGILPGFGFSMRDHLESAVARAFLSVSERSVVVADHSKIGKRTLARFATFAEIDCLITDSGVDQGDRERLAAAGLEMIIAEPLAGTAAATAGRDRKDDG
jgi:DeoR family transcriptional regulator of aga operon